MGQKKRSDEHVEAIKALGDPIEWRKRPERKPKLRQLTLPGIVEACPRQVCRSCNGTGGYIGKGGACKECRGFGYKVRRVETGWLPGEVDSGSGSGDKSPGRDGGGSGGTDESPQESHTHRYWLEDDCY